MTITRTPVASRRRRWPARLTAACAAWLSLAATAQVTPPGTLQTRSVQSVAGHCCWDNAWNTQTAQGAADTYYVNSWGLSWARISAQPAQFGQLAGQLAGGSQLPEGFVASGSAVVLRDAWSDLFTISSTTLAPGTPVQLQLTVLLDVDMLTIDPDGSGIAAATGRAAAAIHSGGWDAPWLAGLNLETGSGKAYSTLDGEYSNSNVYNTTVGATLHLVGDMSLNFNHSSSYDARAWGEGHTFASAVYRVDVLTPGVQVTTASGFDYATPVPVPEPGSWALMLAGLCAVGPWVRRRLR
ncbi:MAG: hypothetical protein Fur0014_05190 [Rubrivivax sp.]